MESPKEYRFGKCRYETRRMILYRGDREVPNLQPLHRNLLVYFLEHPKTVISQKTLHEVGWGQVTVAKEALNRAISELRKHLGSSGRTSRYIRTVEGGGYEFIEDVDVDDDSGGAETNIAASGIGGAAPTDIIHKEMIEKAHTTESADNAPQAMIAEPSSQIGRKKLLTRILIVIIVLSSVVGGIFATWRRPTLESSEPSQPLSHIGDQPLLIRGKNFRSWLTVRVIFPSDPGKSESEFVDLPPSAITWHGSHTATCLIDFNSRPFPHHLQLRHLFGLHSNLLPIDVAPLIQSPVINGIAPRIVKPKHDNQLIIVYGAHFQQGPQVNLRFPDGISNLLNPELIERTTPSVIRLRLYLIQEGQYQIQITNNNSMIAAPFDFTVTSK